MDIAYGVRLVNGPRAVTADVAVVSDRGCDRIRFFRIDRTSATPLSDVTAANVSRVFPLRYDQPSPSQAPQVAEGWVANPLDDQNTVYGLTVARGSNAVFVTERERGVVRELRIVPDGAGRLGYQTVRTFVFDTTFELADGAGSSYDWSPCREAVQEEPQSEGLVFDEPSSTLYVAFETIGLYRIPFSSRLPALVHVRRDRLTEPITSFGRPYRATPDEDEFTCEYDPDGDPSGGAIDAPGSARHAGRFLRADLEGLTILASTPGQTIMLASSQGDSSFHFYQLQRDRARHLGAFTVDGVGETDGVHYVPGPITSRYPLGLLVVQNGDAPAPPDTGDVNGYEFDGATRFEYVNFADALKTLLR